MTDDVSGLTKLGSQQTEYKYEGPTAGMLETFPNKYPDDYLVTHETTEFTSLCPKTGQPDFAKITIEYVPNEVCIESKSLKLYLFAYRNYGSFMESIVNKIKNDLTEVLKPRAIVVEGKFASRGGIHTSAIAREGNL